MVGRLLNKTTLHLHSSHGTQNDFSRTTFSIPPDIFHNARSVYHVWISNLTFTMDNDLIMDANNKVVVNGTPLTVNTGRPSIVQVCAEISGSDVTFSYNLKTNKVSIKNKLETPTIVNFFINNSLCNVLGFDLASLTIPAFGTITGTRQVALRSPNLVYVRSNLGNSWEGEIQSLTKSSILCAIPTPVGSYEDVIYEDDRGLHRVVLHECSELNRFFISLHDAFDDLPLLLNSHFNLSLTIEEHDTNEQRNNEREVVALLRQTLEAIQALNVPQEAPMAVQESDDDSILNLIID
jgi:hypothetical protein